MKYLALASTLALVACNSGGGSSPPPPPPPPTSGAPPITVMLQLPAGSGWTQQYGGGFKLNVTGQTFNFAFPTNVNPPLTQTGTNHVNYIVKSVAPLTTAKSITFGFTVAQTANAAYYYKFEPTNTCPTPGSVTPYFQQVADNGQEDTYRFWANSYKTPIVPGTHNVTVLFDPTKWGSVFGHVASTVLAGWQAALANPQAIGMTFGGGCFDGHGLALSAGSSTFTLNSFTVN